MFMIGACNRARCSLHIFNGSENIFFFFFVERFCLYVCLVFYCLYVYKLNFELDIEFVM